MGYFADYMPIWRVLAGERTTRLPLQSWRNFLYMHMARFLHHLDQLKKIWDAE